MTIDIQATPARIEVKATIDEGQTFSAVALKPDDVPEVVSRVARRLISAVMAQNARELFA